MELYEYAEKWAERVQEGDRCIIPNTKEEGVITRIDPVTEITEMRALESGKTYENLLWNIADATVENAWHRVQINQMLHEQDVYNDTESRN